MSARKLAIALPVVLLACNQEGLTRDEAVDALTESSIESQASAVTAAPIEISTNFTIGKAVANAAAELRGFLAAELPCANVTVQGATVTTEWGATGGCTYKGMTYTGTSSVTLQRTDASTLEVDHTWTDLSNGKIQVSGTAHVTWSAAEHSATSFTSCIGRGSRIIAPAPVRAIARRPFSIRLLASRAGSASTATVTGAATPDSGTSRSRASK